MNIIYQKFYLILNTDYKELIDFIKIMVLRLQQVNIVFLIHLLMVEKLDG